MVSRLVFVMMVASLAVPSLAMAQDEVVAAAAHAAKLPTAEEQAKAAADAKAKADQAPKAINTPAQNVAWLADASKGVHDDQAASGGQTAPRDNSRDGRTIHGSFGVSMGTGGYSSAYVSSLIPIGENGTLGIAVSTTNYGKNSGFGYYDGGYGNYRGYGAGGYGGRGYGRGYGQRGGTSQSVAVSLDLGGDGNSTVTPAGCAPGFYKDGRYVEPVWVSRMHADASCDSDELP